MKKQELKGKYMIAFDTVCDGWQCTNDHEGKPNPEFFDSEGDAMHELFADAIAGIEGNEEVFDENEELDRDEVLAEMEAILEQGDTNKMREYLDANPDANYYDDFIVPADEFVLGKKTIFTGKGIVIEGKKLEEL